MYFLESLFLILTMYNSILTQSAQTKHAKQPPAGKQEENPKKDEQQPCKTYKIELVEDDKGLSGIKPKSTEIFQEAKANGLVPISTTTVFASPSAVGLTGRLPDTLLKTLKTVETNIGTTGGEGEDGHKFTFLGGVVAEMMSDDKKKEDENKDKEPPAEGEGGAGGPPAGGEGGAPPAEGGEAPKLKSSSQKLKTSKLLSKKEMLPSLRESVPERDEQSESLLMAKDE